MAFSDASYPSNLPVYNYQPRPSGRNNGWSPHRNPISKFMLCSVWSPGICLGPQGAGIERALDDRRGYGMDWSIVVFTGRLLGEFTMPIILLTDEDWQDWQVFRELIHDVPRRFSPVSASGGGYAPGKSMSIWHPQLMPLGITQVVTKFEPQEDIEEKMRTVIPLKFKHIMPLPRAAYTKPEADQQKPPMSPLEKAIDDQEKANALASGQQVNEAAGL